MSIERVVEVELSAPLTVSLSREAQSAWPQEACGALLGECAYGEWWCVLDAIPVRNEATSSERAYLIPAQRVRAVEEVAQTRGLVVVGFYHSHPGGGTNPSATDLELAWPGYLYLILDCTDGFGLWTLSEDRTAFRALVANVQ